MASVSLRGRLKERLQLLMAFKFQFLLKLMFSRACEAPCILTINPAQLGLAGGHLCYCRECKAGNRLISKLCEVVWETCMLWRIGGHQSGLGEAGKDSCRS